MEILAAALKQKRAALAEKMGQESAHDSAFIDAIAPEDIRFFPSRNRHTKNFIRKHRAQESIRKPFNDADARKEV